MILADTSVPDFTFDLTTPKKPLSLSKYFPKGTNYFYAYPAGEASGFLNKVSTKVEELVAARALSCAGPDISVVKFAATHSSVIGADLIEAFDIPQLPPKQVIVLPKEIDASLSGSARNKAIKTALEAEIIPGSLIMAQPYTDAHLADLFQIPTQLSTWVNDKNNMKQYIATKYMPRKRGIYINGHQLGKHRSEISLPCVIKVSASSSGDGVYICRSKSDLQTAITELKTIANTIFVEQYIDAKRNFGIHFGIPFNASDPIDIIGVNQQLTTADGEFIGGVIDSTTIPKLLLPLERYLLDDVLRKVRAMGWYGIGCFDVLCDQQDRLYLIDSNFRITGMSAYHFLISNSKLEAPLLSFGGEFTGSREEFERHLFPYVHKDSPQRFAQIIALTRYEDTWTFNGSIAFSDQTQLIDRVSTLLHVGVTSPALSHILHYDWQ